MKQLKLKAFYPHLFAIILLILVGFIYFYPTLQGKVVNQSDVSSFVGAAKETIDYRQQTTEKNLSGQIQCSVECPPP